MKTRIVLFSTIIFVSNILYAQEFTAPFTKLCTDLSTINSISTTDKSDQDINDTMSQIKLDWFELATKANNDCFADGKDLCPTGSDGWLIRDAVRRMQFYTNIIFTKTKGLNKAKFAEAVEDVNSQKIVSFDDICVSE